MKYVSLIFLLTLTLFACGKIEVPIVEGPPLPIGTWNIVSVDSGYIVPYRPEQTYNSLGPLDLNGIVTFKENGTGFWAGSVDIITCGLDNFTWVLSDSLGVIYFVCWDHLTKGIIRKMQKDSLIIDYKDWCRAGDRQGASLYYRITAIN